MSDHAAMNLTAAGGARPAEPGAREEITARPHAVAEISLLVDVGTAWTKASVVGRSRGRWRVVAHAAQPTGWGDEALLAALAGRLRGSVDRRVADEIEALLTTAPRIACHTPARPGRLAVAAVTVELSGNAARRAAESAGWVVAEMVAADDGRSLPERLTALASTEVDAWLVAGGFDAARPEQALEAASIVAAAHGAGHAPVLWAGSATLADEVAALFEEGIVTSVPNPCPTAGEENLGPLRQELELLLDRLVEAPARHNLAPIGFRRSVAEIARQEGLRIGGVDLGARYATWVFADGRGETVTAESRVFASGGLGSPSLATPGSSARLARLLAIPVDELAVADTLQTMRARPGTLPASDEELAVTRAAAQVLLAALAEERGGEAIDLLIAAGQTITASPTPMHAMQLLLDGLRPVGVTQIALDTAGTLSPLGSLTDDELAEGIGMIRDDLLTPLGTAVVVHGGRVGQTALTARLHRAGWPDPDAVEVRTGQLAVLPLPRGERADLQLQLGPGVTIPAGHRTRSLRVEVTGGAVGVVLDARDAPMTLPRRLADRRAMLAAWRELLLREPVAREAAAVRVDESGRRDEDSGRGAGGVFRRLRHWGARGSFLGGAGRHGPPPAPAITHARQRGPEPGKPGPESAGRSGDPVGSDGSVESTNVTPDGEQTEQADG
jgi:MutL protein